MASTKWTVKVDSNKKATLLCEMDDPPMPKVTFPVKLKGVCYSPCPINSSNQYAEAGLGDWYWDSFQVKDGPWIAGWDDLRSRDAGSLDELGVNTLRVYCMMSRRKHKDYVPDPWNSEQLFTHKNFLEWCWAAGPNRHVRPIKFVLVGLPVPAEMLWLEQYNKQPQKVKTFWDEVVRETAQQVGSHPAVLGFTIQNEQDGADVCYNNPTFAKFWWTQVNHFAGIVKAAAPGKLVGMATHDDPQIPARASSYMANCNNMDFWGVNTYQTSVLDVAVGPYARLNGTALKPVILTEYGIPATGRRNANDPASIYDDATTAQKAADVIGRVAPQAFTIPLSLGMYHFEYCDEWWNQPEAPNIYTKWSGPRNDGFPNGFWDNDGFGMFSIRRGDGLKPSDDPWDGTHPRKPIDVHTRRPAVFNTLANVYKNAK